MKWVQNPTSLLHKQREGTKIVIVVGDEKGVTKKWVGMVKGKNQRSEKEAMTMIRDGIDVENPTWPGKKRHYAAIPNYFKRKWRKKH